MSNKQARAQATRVQLRNILLIMTDGQVVPMDLNKVTIVDRASGKPLFKEQTIKEQEQC